MGATLELFNDTTSRRLIKSATDGSDFFDQATPPEFFHEDNIPIRIQFLEKNPTGLRTSSPFRIVTVGALVFSLKLFTSDGATVLASQETWTQNTTGDFANTLSASLNLNTAAMATAFASGSTLQIATLLEGKLDDRLVIRRDLTIKRQYNIVGSPVAIENENFLTENQCNDRFVRFVSNSAGKYIELTSPDGSKKVLIGVKNDGSFYADVI